MYRLYEDIRERLGEPLWHDDQGVPRYAPFHPSLCGIYDHWVALLEIACQSCRETFLVASSYSPMELMREVGNMPAYPTEEDSGSFSFVDAPWHGPEQCAGTTMSTDVIRVVEFWVKAGVGEWARHPEHEFTYGRS